MGESVSIDTVRKLIGILIIGVFLAWPAKAWASCSVSVSPNNVVMGQSSVTHFNVSNTGETMGNWVRIQANNQSAYTVANM